MSDATIHSRPFEYPASGQVRTGTLYHASDASSPPRSAVVVVHGLFVNSAMPEIDQFSRRVASRFDVVTIDMRGHGRAPGPFTWGRQEKDDLADLVVFLRALHPSVGVVGFSFGGDVAIFSAALSSRRQEGGLPDALCTVGSPAHLDLWAYRVRWCGWAHFKRILLRRRGRFAPGWPHLRWRRAVDVVSGVSPAPLLILHGERDWLVHPRQGRQLYDAASQPKQLIMIPGVTHAEFIMDDAPELLVKPVLTFLEEHLSGPVPTSPADVEVSLTRDRL